MDDLAALEKIAEEEQLARIRYWQSKTSSERFAETWRLSVEKYGTPQGSLRDGPFRLIRRTATGEEVIVQEWSGLNPMREGNSNP